MVALILGLGCALPDTDTAGFKVNASAIDTFNQGNIQYVFK